MLLSKIFFIVLIICIQKVVFGHTWMEILVKKIQQFDFHQVIILKSSSRKFQTNEDIFYKSINQVVPSVLIVPPSYNESAVMQYYNTTSTEGTLYLIHYCPPKSVYSLSLEHIYDFLSEMSPVLKRSRCLIITCMENQRAKYFFTKILQYGWSKKFLDLTIVHLSKLTDNYYIYYYNNFSGKYSSELLSENTVLFPDKLQNMNGHFIKIFFFVSPPYFNLSRNQEGFIESITGIYFAMLEVLSEHFNFTLKLVTKVNAKDTDGFLKFAREQMLTESVDVLSTPFPLSKYTCGLEIGFIADFMKITGLAPVIQISYMEFTKSIFYNALVIFAIIVMISYLIYILKFDKRYWDYVSIFSLLLNSSLTRIPTRFRERVVFLSIILVSVQYFSKIFTDLFAFQLVNNEISFNTMDDIIQSNLSIYVPEAFFNIVSDGNKALVESNKIFVEDSTYKTCIQMLRQRQARMCLLPRETVEEIVSNPNNALIMKSSSYVFAEIMRGYFYPRASPYVGKFDKIMQRIEESAMQHTWKDYRKIYQREMLRAETDQDLTENISGIKLLYLIVSGYSLACCVFCIEYIVSHIKK